MGGIGSRTTSRPEAVSIASDAPSGKAAGHPWRRRRQSKIGRRGPRVLLHFANTADSERPTRINRQAGRSVRPCLDGPRILHSPTGIRPNRLGLAEPATGRQHRADALSHPPEGWFSRSLFQGAVGGCAGQILTSASGCLYPGAAHRKLDKSRHERNVSDRLEDRDTKTANRTRSTHNSGGARTGRKNENRSVLLGGGYHSWRPPRKDAARRHWLSGNDRLRPRRQTRALTTTKLARHFAAFLSVRRTSCAGTYNQFRLDRNLLGMWRLRCRGNPPQENLRRNHPHLAQGLANGG